MRHVLLRCKLAFKKSSARLAGKLRREAYPSHGRVNSLVINYIAGQISPQPSPLPNFHEKQVVEAQQQILLEQKRLKNEVVVEREAEKENQWWLERDNRQRYYGKMFTEHEMLESGGPVVLKKTGGELPKDKGDAAGGSEGDEKDGADAQPPRPVLSPAKYARKKKKLQTKRWAEE